MTPPSAPADVDVSILVTTYQRPAHLAAALDSIAAQRAPGCRLEVIVSDDGSTDHTPDVVAAFAARLAALPRPLPGLLGANVGINKDNADPERDYPDLYEAVAPHADYVTMNLSSPNTPGLRDLQGEARMGAILSAVAERRARLPHRPPVVVKIAPDLAPESLGVIVETCVSHGVEALLVSNTTIARDAALRSAARAEAGAPRPPQGCRCCPRRSVFRQAAGAPVPRAVLPARFPSR